MISNSLLIPSFNVLSDGAGWSFDDDKKFVDQALNHNPYHSNNSLNLSSTKILIDHKPITMRVILLF